MLFLFLDTNERKTDIYLVVDCNIIVDYKMEVGDPMLKPEEFTLLDHQLPHFNRILSILFHKRGYIDTSTMGCGKTFATVMVGLILGLKLFIFCPKTVKVVWRKVCKLAGVEIVDLVTYQSASSKLRKQPKHGYLHKTVRLRGKTKVEHYYFSPTEKYRRLLEIGVLLVVDEIQFTRNNTAQYRAIQTLVKTIAKGDTPSKFALLSATPFDKPPQAINLMKIIGVIRQEELFIRSRPTGWLELIAYCKESEPSTTESILSKKEGGSRRNEYNKCAFELYSKVVRKGFCSAMPLVIDAECDAKNGFYRLDPKDKETFDKAILLFESAASQSKDPTKSRVKGDTNFAELTTAMVALETSKTSIFERVTRRYLEENKESKVVVGVHYYVVLNELERRLAEYRPLILCGEIDDEDEREEIVDRFNEDDNSRLLLCISKVGGVGISLHDTIGDHPRIMLLSPDFNLIDTHQATGRVYRVGTKSKTTIRLVYVDAEPNERNIHRILVNKSETLRSILQEHTRNDVMLPIDYKEEYECK